MKLIVGLGNIGEKYVTTRHNAGFITLDILSDLQNLTWQDDKNLKSLISKSSNFILAKPTTFMNLSGQAVSKILNYYKIDISDLIVIYDDIDLPLGKIRVRDKGSAGTHNGMKSIIQELGTENFTRIRIGIESRGDITSSEQDLSSFVLGKFTKEEIPLLKESINQIFSELKNMVS